MNKKLFIEVVSTFNPEVIISYIENREITEIICLLNDNEIKQLIKNYLDIKGLQKEIVFEFGYKFLIEMISNFNSSKELLKAVKNKTQIIFNFLSVINLKLEKV